MSEEEERRMLRQALAAEEASAERAFVTRLDALCRPGGSLVGAGVASDGLSGWIDCRMPARTARLQLVDRPREEPLCTPAAFTGHAPCL